MSSAQRPTGSIKLLSAATTTATSATVSRPYGDRLSFQAVATTSSGSGAATVLVEVSNDESNWETLGTIVLAPNTSDSEGFAVASAGWKAFRMRISAISGTGCAVTAYMGVK